jgi:hypothetical protein
MFAGANRGHEFTRIRIRQLGGARLLTSRLAGTLAPPSSFAWFAYFAVPVLVNFEPPHVGCYVTSH